MIIDNNSLRDKVARFDRRDTLVQEVMMTIDNNSLRDKVAQFDRRDTYKRDGMMLLKQVVVFVV